MTALGLAHHHVTAQQGQALVLIGVALFVLWLVTRKKGTQ